MNDPGIGLLPGICASAVALVALHILGLAREPHVAEEPGSRGHIAVPLGSAWLLCLGVVFIIAKWLSHGLFF
jgi:hypothetical protein